MELELFDVDLTKNRKEDQSTLPLVNGTQITSPEAVIRTWVEMVF